MTTELQAAAAEIELNTRAEPAAPSSDAIRAAFEYFTRLMQWQYVKEKYGAAPEDILRSHIAAMEADNKRLREVLTKYATADVTCSYVEVSSRAYEVHEHCEKWAQEALAQAGGKDGE